MSRTALGVDLPDDPSLPQSRRWLFVGLRGGVDAVFRWQLVLVISLVLYKALEPYGLQSVGLLLGLVAVATSVARGVRVGVANVARASPSACGDRGDRGSRSA